MNRKAIPLQELIEKYRANPDFRLGMAMETLQKQLGQLLCEARLRQGLTSEELAAQLEMSPKFLTQLEAGERVCDMSLTTLWQWAHCLGFKLIFEFVPESISATTDSRPDSRLNLRVEL